MSADEVSSRTIFRNRLSDLREWRSIVCRTLASIRPVLRRRRGLILREWEKAAWMGVPIVMAAGFSVGVVSWFQVRDILTTYGAEGNLPSLVTVAVVMQTGPILTGLVCAARLGASNAAELSTMNLTEETDAMAAMGVDVVETLLTPRVIAAAFALPVLTVVTDLSALAGAMTTESVWGDLGPRAFLSRATDLLSLRRSLPATFKTIVFGILTALISCGIGLRCEREAEAVGHAALRSVVSSLFAVLIADMFMVPMIQRSIRMFFPDA